MQLTSLPAQASRRALGALQLLHMHPPNLLQTALFLNKNTTNGANTTELRLRLKDGSIDVCLIQETKLLPKDTTSAVPGFCVIRTDRPTNLRSGGLLTIIRDYLVLQKTGEDYNPPLEHLTVQVQLSRREWVTIHTIYAAPFRSAFITRLLDFARLQMGRLAFLAGDLNALSPLWDTN